MSRYAVIGKPVGHSKSPLIHRLFAEQTGQDVQYEAIEVELEALIIFVKQFFENGGAGLNVTLPYKEQVYALAQSRSNRAQQAQAANTLFLDTEGNLTADNTDGIGLVRDLRDNNRVEIRDSRVLLLGAGGAARGALGALLDEAPASLVIANRTMGKAEQLQQEFRSLHPIEVREFAELSGMHFDLIINATSMGIHNEVPPISATVLATTCCCYDMMYSHGKTAFVQWAEQAGATQALDGIGMLVEQAAEAFAIWRGVHPETASVIAQLRG